MKGWEDDYEGPGGEFLIVSVRTESQTKTPTSSWVVFGNWLSSMNTVSQLVNIYSRHQSISLESSDDRTNDWLRETEKVRSMWY